MIWLAQPAPARLAQDRHALPRLGKLGKFSLGYTLWSWSAISSGVVTPAAQVMSLVATHMRVSL